MGRSETRGGAGIAMADYFRLGPIIGAQNFPTEVVRRLTEIWLDDYCVRGGTDQIIETKTSGFSYLFDIRNERLIAAWGLSQGRNSEPRPAARMAGHPLSLGPLYHRGHAIPHTLGGPADINLVPQLGRINVGPFRALEREAVRTPGALYFTYWIYRGIDGQVPIGVDQGLLVPGMPRRIVRHSN
jgi:hypothetical protein